MYVHTEALFRGYIVGGALIIPTSQFVLKLIFWRLMENKITEFRWPPTS